MPETKGYRSKMMSKIRSTGGKAETLLAKEFGMKDTDISVIIKNYQESQI